MKANSRTYKQGPVVTHRPFSCTLQSALTFSGSSNFLGDFLFLLVDLRLLRGFLLEIAIDLGKLDDPMFRGAQFSLQFLRSRGPPY